MVSVEKVCGVPVLYPIPRSPIGGLFVARRVIVACFSCDPISLSAGGAPR